MSWGNRTTTSFFCSEERLYEVLKISRGFITRLSPYPTNALQRDIGSDKSQLTEKKSIIDFSEMSWGKVQLAWNKWCLKGKDYEGQSFERDGWANFRRTFPECRSHIEFMIYRETVLDVKSSSLRTRQFFSGAFGNVPGRAFPPRAIPFGIASRLKPGTLPSLQGLGAETLPGDDGPIRYPEDWMERVARREF